MSVRLLIVDDHDVVRLGLATALKSRPSWEICGEAANAANAITKVKQLHPDVVVLDIVLPGMTGFDAATEIRRVAPETKIVLFSIHDVPATARLCGADGFVCKASGVVQLIRTIEGIMSGPAGGRSPSPSTAGHGGPASRLESAGAPRTREYVFFPFGLS
jgi:DNA-binding NarL/FixJ family response regulator